MVLVFFLSFFLKIISVSLISDLTASVEKFDARTKRVMENHDNHVFVGQCGVDAVAYFKSLSFLVERLEKSSGVFIEPKNFPKIAIKLETVFAPGLQTSSYLVDGLLEFLRRRGFSKSKLILVDYGRGGLLRGGFLRQDEISKGYRGHRVVTFLDPEYTDINWFHDSPLPPAKHDRAAYYLSHPQNRDKRLVEERKSFLPRILFQDDIYWINLSVAMDDPHLGIDGACSNLTLGAINNFQRFLQSATLAPAAVAEILAIPEIWSKRLFSLIDLSKFQFAGGRAFDAEFVLQDKKMILGKNPFCVDFAAWTIIAKHREKHGFSHRLKRNALLFKYGEELGMGPILSTQIFDGKQIQ